MNKSKTTAWTPSTKLPPAPGKGERAFKLLRRRCNGTLGPLFINARQVIPVGLWLRAESYPTKGFSVRPGWHTSWTPHAPHLSTKGRVWCEVEIAEYTEFKRPAAQGGLWLLAKWLRVVRILDDATLQEELKK